MKPKDTVLTLEQREAFRLKAHKAVEEYYHDSMSSIENYGLDNKAKQICRDIAREELELQAEIAFKACYAEAVKDVSNFEVPMIAQERLEAKYKEGIREVVRWVTENSYAFDIGDGVMIRKMDEEKWKAMLEEWGIMRRGISYWRSV